MPTRSFRPASSKQSNAKGSATTCSATGVTIRPAKPVAGFPLNDSRFGGDILVAAKNFGCGSSREHAAWAIFDYGFKVVVSSFFRRYFPEQCAEQRRYCPSGSSEAFSRLIFAAIAADPAGAVRGRSRQIRPSRFARPARLRLSKSTAIRRVPAERLRRRGLSAEHPPRD
ncbi:MAG: 3-isopropylmalate dehydratase small subunit [Alistipes indistinctus]